MSKPVFERQSYVRPEIEDWEKCDYFKAHLPPKAPTLPILLWKCVLFIRVG